MASLIPIMPFLRPLRLPKSSTVRQFLQYSTTTPCREKSQPVKQPKQTKQREDRNLVASRTASSSYPPPSMPSKPRPKISKASRRTSHPPKERPYPTRQPTHNPPAPRKLIPEPVEFLSAAECAPNLPYFVTRTGSNELPVYHLRKRGGNLLLTQIKKIDGDPLMLRDALNASLPLNDKKGQTAVVNHNTGHVIIKGHWKNDVEKLLRERMF